MSRRRSVKTHTAQLARADHPLHADVVSGPRSPPLLNEAQLAVLQRAIAHDGALQNMFSGMGVAGIDKREATRYIRVAPLTQIELENMWRRSWLAGRVVDAPADDMTREWTKCTWDNYDKDEENAEVLRQAEEDFLMQDVTNESVTWSRLYGGAAVIPLIDGDDDLSKPLDVSLIRKGSLQRFHVVDRWRIGPNGMWDRDRSSKNFGRPMGYLLADAADGAPPVHWSRVIVFTGRRLPYWLWRNNNMWGDSVLENVVDDITDYDTMRAAIGAMMHEAQLDIINAKSTADMMTTATGKQKVQDRWALTKQMRSQHRMLVLDENEKFSQKTNTWSGLDHIWDKSIINVCGASHTPITILFGQSPAGFSTGDTDLRTYYDRIKKDQQRLLRPGLKQMYDILLMSTFGSIPKNFKFSFNPLWQISTMDQATIDKTNADRDVALVNASIITPQLAAREMKDRGTYRTMEDDDVELAAALIEQPVDDPADPAAMSKGRPAQQRTGAGAKPKTKKPGGAGT